MNDAIINKSIKEKREEIKLYYIQNKAIISNDLLLWFENTYETINNKNPIKLKIVYYKYLDSDYYGNLKLIEKRHHNYKSFIERIKQNETLNKHLFKSSNESYFLINYERK